MGDFGANFNLPSTGIHTVEGNVAGPRAASLTKQRQAAQEEFELKRQKIKHESQQGRKSMDDKFDSNSAMSFEERMFRSKTVGLVSAQDFAKAQKESEELAKKRKQGLLNEDGSKVAGNGEDGLTGEERNKFQKKRRKEIKRQKNERKKMLNTLSFADAEDADDIIHDLKADYSEDKGIGIGSLSTKTTAEVKKDPTIDTSFLPDKDREGRMAAERRRLQNEWIANQNKLKKELLEITYSYWDGSGHRRTVTVKKGDSIAEFLEQVRKGLSKEFREMANASSDALLYIKEDLIIPLDISFYSSSQKLGEIWTNFQF